MRCSTIFALLGHCSTILLCQVKWISSCFLLRRIS
uniref:Uncharacterized protein n=1 Tax=Arundo donax TaxID=35708 RepID=A0A0A9FEQ2_ARUDO